MVPKTLYNVFPSLLLSDDAEIIQHKQGASGTEYYVHYMECTAFVVVIVTAIVIDLSVSFLVISDNKRLDEWLPESRVEQWSGGEPTTPGPPSALNSLHNHLTRSAAAADKLDPAALVDSNRKMTRNLKRRFDEMHHVQRVSVVC